MNRVVSFVSAFLALLAAVAVAQAQGIEKARADCKQQRDRDRTIAGCTVIIYLGNRETAAQRATALYLRGNAYYEKGDYDHAVADLTESARLDPGHVDPFYLRGLAYDAKNDHDRAIADFDHALQLKPNDPDMLFSRGMAYAVKGEYDSGVAFKDRFELNRALADFDAAIKPRPNAAVGYIHRGMVHNAMGNYERAIADYNQAIALRGDLFVAYYNRGFAYFRNGKPDLAIADFERTIQMEPTFSLAFNNRGFARLAKGEHDRAIADFGEAIRLDPRDVLPLKHRGEAYWITGDLDRALRDYEAALALAPGDEAAKKAHDAVKAAMGTSTAPQESRSRAVNERRIALVIGNSRYENMARLPNPTNDASDLAGVLKGLGFEVTLGIDLKRGQMEDAAIAFAKAARNADTALVFYAGHGMQHEGINYLAPVDARLDDVADLQRLMKVQDLIANLQTAKTARILILDACRDNDAIKQLASQKRGLRRGLAAEKADGILIAFATQANQSATDGDQRNSPFTAALLRNLPTPGLELRTALTRVRSDVLRATGGEQRPETSDSLDGEVVLKPLN